MVGRTTDDKTIVILTKKQKGFADSIIDQANRGEEPNVNKAVRDNYDTVNPKVTSELASNNLSNPRIKEYLVERISGGEILDQKDAFSYIQNESQELLSDTKKMRDNKTRLGVLQFIGKLYGLGADKVIIKTETTTPRVAKIYDLVSEQEYD